MAFDFKKRSALDERMTHFEDTEVLRRVKTDEAKRLAAKAKDCIRQIDSATSIWAIDGKKFLFVFTDTSEEGHQKATVWGQKAPGDYQRIKTVLVSCPNYIFEAVPAFLTEYFELSMNPDSYQIDVDWFYDIEDELAILAKAAPAYLKPKMKLLRTWSEIMPRYNRMVSDLDFKVLRATEPDMADVVAPHETDDPIKMLESLHKLNPEAFKDLIKKVITDDVNSYDDKKDPFAAVSAPDFIERIAEKWEKNEVDDNSPSNLIDAYIRFNRAWNSFRAAVVADMFGPICTAYNRRTERLACLIDRKLHQTKNVDERTHLMNLFRLLMPQFIDEGDEEGERNFKYEKSWNKVIAERIVKEGVLNGERAELLIRVREDFKRLPAPVSKFIKTELPLYIESDMAKIDKDYVKDLSALKNGIKTVDNFIQWKLVMEQSDNKTAIKADACFEIFSKEIEKTEDIEAWSLYCNLMMTGFAPVGTVRDRKRFIDRVETRLKKLLSSDKPGNTKNLADELLLASMWLENAFLEDKECDIYTSYWAMHHQDKMQDEIWRTNGGGLFWP